MNKSSDDTIPISFLEVCRSLKFSKKFSQSLVITQIPLSLLNTVRSLLFLPPRLSALWTEKLAKDKVAKANTAGQLSGLPVAHVSESGFTTSPLATLAPSSPAHLPSNTYWGLNFQMYRTGSSRFYQGGENAGIMGGSKCAESHQMKTTVSVWQLRGQTVLLHWFIQHKQDDNQPDRPGAGQVHKARLQGCVFIPRLATISITPNSSPSVLRVLTKRGLAYFIHC